MSVLSAPATASTPPARRWLALLVVCLGMMMTFLTITLTLSTLTPVQRALHASNADTVWIASIYTMVVAMLVLTAGTIGDIIGRRVVFVTGVIVMAVGSAVVMLANDTTSVIVGQAVMGVGGALILPNSLAMATHIFTEPHERTTAVSIWVAVSGVGLALGPIGAGVLLRHFSWHSAFAVNIVMAVLVLALTAAFVDDSRLSGRRLDPAGLVLGILAIGALNYAVIEGGNDGFGDRTIVATFIATAVFVIAFVVVELRGAAPMLHLGLFRNRSFSAANAVAFLGQFAFVGISFVLVLYFEQVNRYSILSTGVRLLTLTATYIVVSAVVSRLVRYVGFKAVLVVGLLAMAAGSFLLLTMGPSTSFVRVGLILVLISVAGGLILPPSTAVAVITVPPNAAGMASGAVNMFRQIGGALGASVLGTVLTEGFVHGLPGRLADHGVGPQAAARITDAVANGADASAAPASLRQIIDSAAGASFTTAFHHAVLIPAVGALAMAVVAAVFIHSRPSATRAALVVRGAVRAVSGAPVAQAALTLIDGAGRAAGRQITGADGAYRIEAPGSGEYVLIVRAPQHQPQALPVAVAGETGLDVRLTGAGRLAGTVRTAVGAPVPGATVTATDERGEVAAARRTGADGAYAVDGLGAGDYTLVAAAGGFRPGALSVTVPATGTACADLELAGAARLQGRVTLAGLHRPLADVVVSLRDSGGNVTASARTGTAGEYTFEEVPAGDYTVTAAGYRPASGAVSIGAGDRHRHDLSLGFAEEPALD